MLKLIAIDLDGTLLDDNKKLQNDNIRALEELHNRGVEIVIATGRSYSSAIPYVKQIKEGIIEFLICNNGTSVYNLIKDEVLVDDCLNSSQVKEILDLADKLENMKIHFLGRDIIYVYSNPVGKYVIEDAYISFLDIKFMSKEELIKSHITKALITTDKEYIKEVFSSIPKEYFEKYNIVNSAENLIEILNKNADKGHALKAIMDDLNIDKKEVIAIGDQGNDIGMFEVAGKSYAMEASSDFIKSKATHIGPSNNNNGVSKIISEIMEEL
ncbi:MAG: Cof-type HAD-IIB family hydrolase [Helcococcus sp.]|nr:Cof-type HAD-IIB family hydrolase [Helcococcus sp.]